MSTTSDADFVTQLLLLKPANSLGVATGVRFAINGPSGWLPSLQTPPMPAGLVPTKDGSYQIYRLTGPTASWVLLYGRLIYSTVYQTVNISDGPTNNIAATEDVSVFLASLQ
jgi:hypothetical protein